MSSTLKRKAGAATGGNDAKKPKANASIASFFGAPKPGPATGSSPAAAPSTPTIKFDKAKWVAGLTDEQRELLQLEIDTLDESWLAQLKDDVTTKEFLNLKRFLHQETKSKRKWFPPAEDVYSWSRHTPFHNVKVVIVGQDPYHNDNQAHGMAFSVRPPTPAPPSLRNMYKALKKDYPSFVEPANRGGLLTPWADRGVLMLNTCLTVRAHDAFSHANRGWERFTQRVIELIAKKRTRGVVFMAWGVPAGKRVQKIDRQRHLILESVHPSPLSASRGFFDCRHFRSSNEWLISRYGPDAEIDWALKPGNTTKEAPPAPPAAPAAAAPAEAPAAEADAAATTTPSKDAAAPAPEPASASPTPKKAEDKLKTEDKSKPEEQSKPEDKPKANDKVKTQEKTKDEANKENGPAGEEEFDSGDEDALEEALRLAEGAATKPA